jgi:hypothetical protein
VTTSMRPSRDSDRSAARRAAAWAHHPDLGGDPDAFITTFTAIDATYGAVGDRDVPVIVVRHARWRRVTIVVNSVVRRVAPKRARYVQI